MDSPMCNWQHVSDSVAFLLRAQAAPSRGDWMAMVIESSFSEQRPFEVQTPVEQMVPFVFNSPHSGRHYPGDFLKSSRLDAHTIRVSEDYFVDELFGSAPFYGAPLLVAHFPRAFLDVNREPYELDPTMFEGSLPHYLNTNSVRVAGGLGTIPRLVAENLEIYHTPMRIEDALNRIESFYRPYHDCLRNLIVSTHAAFGACVLVDCHSMPAHAQSGSRNRPDFVIGDRFGTSASDAVSQSAISLLKDLGYTVARNKPYAGGFITEHYGRPRRGLHALQIEINRGLYVDEQTFQKNAGFERLQADLARFVDRLTGDFYQEPDAVALAAE